MAPALANKGNSLFLSVGLKHKASVNPSFNFADGTEIAISYAPDTYVGPFLNIEFF